MVVALRKSSSAASKCCLAAGKSPVSRHATPRPSPTTHMEGGTEDVSRCVRQCFDIKKAYGTKLVPLEVPRTLLWYQNF